MFLHINLLQLNAFLKLFQFLLIGAYGSIISIYSRFGGEYSNSIRWVSNGGLLDKFYTLFHSFSKVPISTRVVFIITVIGGIAVNLANLGASQFIKPAIQQKKGAIIVTNLSHYIQEIGVALYGWSTTIPIESNMTEAAMLMINNTRNIKNPVVNRLYSPLTVPYEPICNNVGFRISTSPGILKTPSPSSDGSMKCGSFLFTPSFVYSRNNSADEFPQGGLNDTIISSSQDNWSFNFTLYDYSSVGLFAATFQYLVPELEIGEFDNRCFVRARPEIVEQHEYDGLTAFPRTYLKKCNIGSYAQTVIPFTSEGSSPENSFNMAVNQSFAEAKDDIFRSMRKSAKATNRNILNDRNITLYNYRFAEVRVVNTTIDILECIFHRGDMNPDDGGDVGVGIFDVGEGASPSKSASDEDRLKGRAICLYTSTSVIFQRPQDSPFLWDNNQPVNGSDLVIDHYSITPIGPNNIMIASPVSLSLLKSKTKEAAEYLSKLGPNFKIIKGTAHIVYETTDPENGMEVLLWLFHLIIALMALSLVLWALTEKFLNERYTSSLFKLITMEVVPLMKNSCSPPVLFKARIEPAFEIEGHLVLENINSNNNDNNNNNDKDNDSNDNNSNNCVSHVTLVQTNSVHSEK